MEERDYLVKEIEKLKLLLAKILRLRQEDKDADIREEARSAYAGFFGLDIDGADIATLREAVGRVNGPQKLELLAELLEADLAAGHEPIAQEIRTQVLECVITEIDRQYAAEGTFSFTNQLRKKK